MIEDSPEGFVQRWRPYATPVRLFAHTEGSPLLEGQVGSVIVQMLERTGPYLSRPGLVRFIVNPMVERLERTAAGAKALEVTGLGRLRGRGEVTLRDDDVVILDCGVPLVVAILDRAASVPAVGDFVEFEALPPVHAFLVHDDVHGGQRRVHDSPDDLM